MGESSGLLLKKGQTFLNLGNPKKALKIYEIILKDEPQNIEALIKKRTHTRNDWEIYGSHR